MIWVFWISIAIVFYSYLGYPLWLGVRKWWAPRPIRRGSMEPSVSVLMVVKNEGMTIRRKMDNLLGLDYPADKLQVVIVSDGSTDTTNRILEHFEQDSRVVVRTKDVSEGKAAGLNDAIAVASGEIALFTDARQSIEMDALRTLVQKFADPEVGCVSGELMLGDPETGEAGKGMGLYWLIEKRVREMESASGSVVGATGAIYCARTALLSPIPPGTILDDVLIPMQIVRQGFRVVFEPDARAWDSPDLGGSREFSRKVRTLSGNYQLLQIAPWLLGSENPVRFEFISHKLSRLVVPMALISLLLSSVFLNDLFYRVALGGQVLVYVLGLMAVAGMRIGPLARIADAAKTFVVLNSAAMVAFFNFVSRRQTAWVR